MNSLLATTTLPFVLLCFFARPVSDDFSFANSVVRYGFWEAQAHWFQTWTGRYFSTFLASLFSDPQTLFDLYALGPLIVMGFFFAALWFFSRALITLCCHDGKSALTIALVLFALATTQMPTTAEGYYWVAGAFGNTIGFGLFLLLLGILISVNAADSPRRSLAKAVAGAILALMVAGSNETLLVVALGTLSVGGWIKARARLPGWKVWVAILVVFCFGAFISVMAPGNFARAAAIRQEPRILHAAPRSVIGLVVFLRHFIVSPPLIAATVAMVSSFNPLVGTIGPRLGIGRRKLLLFPACWLGLLALALFPAYWATGELPPGRAMNTVYFTFLVGWFPSILMLAEYIRPHFAARIFSKEQTLVFAMAALIVSLFVSPGFRRAVGDLNGPAQLYASELDNRFALLRNSSGAALIVPPLQASPATIMFDPDVTFEPRHPRNRAIAEFFGLESIARLRPRGSTRPGDGRVPLQVR